MALDKLVDSAQLDSDLTSVANAIRAKSGGSGQLAFPSGFVSEIGIIPSGGGGLGNFTLLDTFTLTEDVAYLDMDVSSYDYDQFAIVVNATGTGADYLYVCPNKTGDYLCYINGNSYVATAVITKAKLDSINTSLTALYCSGFAVNSSGNTTGYTACRKITSGVLSYIRCKSYRANGVLNSGGTFALYGR